MITITARTAKIGPRSSKTKNQVLIYFPREISVSDLSAVGPSRPLKGPFSILYGALYHKESDPPAIALEEEEEEESSLEPSQAKELDEKTPSVEHGNLGSWKGL